MHAMRATALILSISSLMAGQASAGLVLNGGFETGDFTNWNYRSNDDFSFVDGGFVHSGNYAAWFGDLQANGGGSISQSIATSVGATYALSFWFAGDRDFPSGFKAIAGGRTLFNVTNPAFDLNYLRYSFNFVATSTSTLIEFDAYDDPFYINLDDVDVVFVPEPSSVTLLGVGLGALALARKRRPRRD